MFRIALIALVAIGLSACGKEPQQSAPPPPEVTVVTANAADVPLQRELSGRLSAFRSADVRARVPGVLQKRAYTEGSAVREGDVLFVVDPSQLQAALGTAQGTLAQAEANYANAKSFADRARQLKPGQFISASDYDNALAAERTSAAAVQAARASVQAARINLGYATVRAPISGIAGKQQVTEGALVGADGATLLTTVDQIDTLYVNFSIGVAELQQIREAMAAAGNTEAEVSVRLPDGSEFEHKGKVDFAADVVDPATGAVSMRASLLNPDHRLLPGTYVTLVATMGTQKNVFRIPQAAVQRDAVSAYVMVVGADDTVARKDINLVRAELGDWIVDRGLANGDRVIVSGLQRAGAGAKVVAKPAEGASAAPAKPEAAADTAPAEDSQD